jgi:hypothetical protein
MDFEASMKAHEFVRGNATLIAIVRDGRRRCDKMFSPKYLANDITFLEKFFPAFFRAMGGRIEENLVGVAVSMAWELMPKTFIHF